MTKIKKVAVIGSGVMGAAIAAHIANSGTEVLLYDMVPGNLTSKNRSILAQNAIDKLPKLDPAPLTSAKNIKLMSAVNLEDDLQKLEEVDWIIEAVLEDVQIKRDLYIKILKYKKSSAIISSNTSTIPLNKLIDGMPSKLQNSFVITHFFNPPRYMQLLEFINNPKTKSATINDLKGFIDIKLGKTIVDCNDTPGFIANRIGCFWITKAILEAIRLNVDIEEADALLSRPIGVPKTGVFGLTDLIGIDLMPLIAKSFAANLKPSDEFVKIYKEPAIITDMIKTGYTGRKGKGGFYRLNEANGKKIKEVKSLKDGKYYPAQKPNVELAKKGAKNWSNMLGQKSKLSKYVSEVMLNTLAYTASLVGEIADNIKSIDDAMKAGYNWKYGPFELIDKLADDKNSGPENFATYLTEHNIEIPKIIKKAGNKNFYNIEDNKRFYLNIKGKYDKIEIPSDKWMLSDKKLGKSPIAKNPSASLWDIGDNIACLEYTSKMNSVDPLILEMIEKSIQIVKKDFKGLVIYNDSDNFCVGANIGVLLFAANVGAYSQIRDIIKQGQDAYMALKFAPFPVVVAPTGMALGGGCEILMHADNVCAHIETYTGLVEVGVGIIPGWGGCKEMLLRHLESTSLKELSLAKKGGMFVLALKQALTGGGGSSLRHPIITNNTMPAISKAFEYIATAKVAKSAAEAADMLILRETDEIIMNRTRLLPAAKNKCLQLSKGYVAPEPATLRLPGATAKTALQMAIDSFVKTGKATKYDAVISERLSYVLSGGDTDILENLTEQDLLDLEIEVFMELVKNNSTLDRIETMLNTGKPLRN